MAIFYFANTLKILPVETIAFGFIFLWVFTASIVSVWVHTASTSYYLKLLDFVIKYVFINKFIFST